MIQMLNLMIKINQTIIKKMMKIRSTPLTTLCLCNAQNNAKAKAKKGRNKRKIATQRLGKNDTPESLQKSGAGAPVGENV
jgi:hypothetical protein